MMVVLMTFDCGVEFMADIWYPRLRGMTSRVNWSAGFQQYVLEVVTAVPIVNGK